MENKKAFVEAIKEPLRLLVISILPLAVSYFAGMPYQWAAVITLLLRWLDKFLHELSKEQPAKERNEGLFGVKGLTGF